MKFFILLLIASSALNAKQIYVDIQLSPTFSYRDEYTVDPSVKVWQLKEMIFKNNDLDWKKYVLARRPHEEFSVLEPDNSLTSYGNAPQDPVLFFVIKKTSGLEKEEPAPHEPAKDSEKPEEKKEEPSQEKPAEKPQKSEGEKPAEPKPEKKDEKSS
ncbi:MAG TPA: hypothetical protein VEL47_05610 [Myxococcota bacterium]|nr:hypothetical protein [Myxococcota bacterium]